MSDKELSNKEQRELVSLLTDANEILRSVSSIIERQGANTYWPGIEQRVTKALNEQHPVVNRLRKQYLEQPVITALDVRKTMTFMSNELEQKFVKLANAFNWTIDDIKEIDEFLSEFKDYHYQRGQDSMNLV